MPVAGKTGTTSANRDRWFCGYTPYYTCAVWTGYDTPETMAFSGNPATQIWQKVMSAVHADLPRKEFKISYGGSATGIFGTREELEEQALTEEEKKQKEEQAKHRNAKAIDCSGEAFDAVSGAYSYDSSMQNQFITLTMKESGIFYYYASEEVKLYDESGKYLGVFSYNGRFWPKGCEPR